MEDWFRANKLTLYINKTCYVVYSSKNSRKKDSDLKLVINGQCINKVSSCKYLGVHIDDVAKWNVHIDYIYNKLIKFTSIFYKMRTILPKHCLYKLYHAFVHPHIVYGIEVYGNTCASVLDKLCKLNNKLLRILLNANFEIPVKELYNSFRVLPIPLCLNSKCLPLCLAAYIIANIYLTYLKVILRQTVMFINIIRAKVLIYILIL